MWSSWRKGISWWISWLGGLFIGVLGFLVRVIVLSVLVGENLWVIITRASYGLVDKFIELFNLPFSPSIQIIQLVAILLITFQEMVYVLTLHLLAYSLFPRLNSTIPDPPRILNNLVDFNS